MVLEIDNSVRERIQGGDIESAVGLDERLRAAWGGVGDAEHFVQFYEADSFLLDSLSGFIGEGLCAGDACVVVATRDHRAGLDERLRARGVDVDASKESGQFVSLDAGETLPHLLVEGSPDPRRFAETIGGVVGRAAERSRRVRVFGELVALLWAEGNYGAALRLEELWNSLGEKYSFSLFCGYPLSGFGGEALAEPLSGVCAAHSRVIPAESYTSLTDPDERLRAIILLQQKAQTLQSMKDELEVQVEDLRRLHEMSVSLTGTLDIEPLLGEVLRAAMDVQGTDLGLLSLCDAVRGGLRVAVQSGFKEEFIRQIEWVPSGAGACGTCYLERRRVVVEDVETDPVFEPYRESARAAGMRSCHSTPLITRAGHIIGVLSVHFRETHRPSERETRLMDLYARMAADIIENAQLHRQVTRESEERRRLLTREQMARAEAESANRLKDEFLATVSHELRTPLTAIMGWSHMLRDGRLDEKTARRALDCIERNARSQAQLVEDLLDVSRVVAGKLRLCIGAVDLSSVINDAIDSVQLAADSKGIRLEVTLDPSARHVSGDAGRLQQVVWNLLSNAIKFTEAGGSVRVRLEREGPDARIRVSDTGQGINTDFLPYVFDLFRQGDGSTTRSHGGLGLGLAIVRHLVELHGGAVSADSEGGGRGATFTIKLPLAAADKRARGRSGETGSLRAGG